MMEFIANRSRPPFARFWKPKPSLLRRTETQALRHDLPNVSVMTTASFVEVGFSFRHPLVVTSRRPQAKMSPEQDSMTSLNPQGRAVNV